AIKRRRRKNQVRRMLWLQERKHTEKNLHREEELTRNLVGLAGGAAGAQCNLLFTEKLRR
nr:hypothetical protein [Chlamydiota bacterium]